MADQYPFIPRGLWGSRTEWSDVPAMRLPAEGVFVHHSVTNPTGDADVVLEPTDDPCKDARRIEEIGIARFGRLSYSYLFHPAGVILEGAATNSGHLGLCFIGNMLDDDPTAQPTPPAIGAFTQVVKALSGFGVLRGRAFLRPHSAVKATACPGLTAAQIDWLRGATGLAA
jgi:N-acetylmuramoyl-L-alanine amidase